MVSPYAWADVDWIPEAAPLKTAPLLIDSPGPQVRPDGGVLGKARHRVTPYESRHAWPREIVLTMEGMHRYTVLSAWILDYAEGDFSGLHSDRPDSAVTALVALGDLSDPLVLCDQLIGETDESLLRHALENPFPPGLDVILRQDRCLLVQGSITPHHRPPVTSPCKILSISLRQVS